MQPVIRILGLLILFNMMACKNKKTTTTDLTPVSQDTVVPAQNIDKDSLLLSTSNAILLTLKNKDLRSFSGYFEKDMAIRFSPYGYVDTASDLRFSRAAFDSLVASGAAVVWGSQDGSGDPIRLSASAYFDKYVYNADFLRAEKMAIDSFIGQGNSLNNLKKIYPGSRFVEYHFSGFDKKYGGMDWTSLRLVFKEVDRSYKLIAIVHDQWTI
jgi:hypothetical protein